MSSSVEHACLRSLCFRLLSCMRLVNSVERSWVVILANQLEQNPSEKKSFDLRKNY